VFALLLVSMPSNPTRLPTPCTLLLESWPGMKFEKGPPQETSVSRQSASTNKYITKGGYVERAFSLFSILVALVELRPSGFYGWECIAVPFDENKCYDL